MPWPDGGVFAGSGLVPAFATTRPDHARQCFLYFLIESGLHIFFHVQEGMGRQQIQLFQIIQDVVQLRFHHVDNGRMSKPCVGACHKQQARIAIYGNAIIGFGACFFPLIEKVSAISSNNGHTPVGKFRRLKTS